MLLVGSMQFEYLAVYSRSWWFLNYVNSSTAFCSFCVKLYRDDRRKTYLVILVFRVAGPVAIEGLQLYSRLLCAFLNGDGIDPCMQCLQHLQCLHRQQRWVTAESYTFYFLLGIPLVTLLRVAFQG